MGYTADKNDATYESHVLENNVNIPGNMILKGIAALKGATKHWDKSFRRRNITQAPSSL